MVPRIDGDLVHEIQAAILDSPIESIPLEDNSAQFIC